MALTRNQRKSGKGLSSKKCRKTPQTKKEVRSTIDHCLPNAILGNISGFLPKSSRALFAAALSSSSSSTKVNCDWNNERWETLDFADLPKDLAAKLTDYDLASVLDSIGASEKLQILKLTGCVNIIVHALKVLRDSIALRQIDLSLVGQRECPELKPEPMISEAVVIPILNSVVDTFGNTLRHIQLPKKWRAEQSSRLYHFLSRYNKWLTNRFASCSKCDDVIRDRTGTAENEWISNDTRLQNYTCNECTKRFCHECELDNVPFFCETCEKKFCMDCVPTNLCQEWDKIACHECLPMEQCGECLNSFCGECTPVETCGVCDRTRCMDCLSLNICAGDDCNKANCIDCEDCEDMNTVQWCEACYGEFCSDCHLKEYNKDRENFSIGCRALLFPTLPIENESLHQKIEELQNQEPTE